MNANTGTRTDAMQHEDVARHARARQAHLRACKCNRMHRMLGHSHTHARARGCAHAHKHQRHMRMQLHGLLHRCRQTLPPHACESAKKCAYAFPLACQHALKHAYAPPHTRQAHAPEGTYEEAHEQAYRYAPSKHLHAHAYAHVRARKNILWALLGACQIKFSCVKPTTIQQDFNNCCYKCCSSCNHAQTRKLSLGA
jgi:hypothetical protein